MKLVLLKAEASLEDTEGFWILHGGFELLEVHMPATVFIYSKEERGQEPQISNPGIVRVVIRTLEGVAGGRLLWTLVQQLVQAQLG